MKDSFINYNNLGWLLFLSGIEIHHSMPSLLLEFLLRNVLLFWWIYLYMLEVLSYSFQYSFLVLYI
jgi:hypothetical protein